MLNERDKLKPEIARCYGLKQIEDWLWVKPGEPRTIGKFRADGLDLLIRIYEAGTDADQVAYHTELINRLESVGVAVEQLVRTVTGDACIHLSTGEAAMLFVRYTDPSMPGLFSADEASAWGKFTAHIHAACENWRPNVQVATRLLRRSPEATLDRAMSLAAQLPYSSAVLKEVGPTIISGCQRILENRNFQPVHGDLWPGNIVVNSTGLRAVNFREAGDGPTAIDLGTAFAWMPWRENFAEAPLLWDAWLSGYAEVRKPAKEEVSSAPAFACLRRLHWLVVEAEEAEQKLPEYTEAAYYIEDHCRAIQAILEGAEKFYA